MARTYVTTGLAPCVIRALTATGPAIGYRLPACTWRALVVAQKKGFLAERDGQLVLSDEGRETREMLLDVAYTYRRGVTAARLGRRYDVTEKSITRWLRAMREPVYRSGSRITPGQADRIAAAYQAGSGINFLRTVHHISEVTLHRILAERNITVRPPGRRPGNDTYTLAR